MNDNEKNEENFFEKFGLEVAGGEVEIGSVYPIYGMITKFISDDLDYGVVVEVNFNLELTLTIDDPEKLELVKTRSFEPGIFVTKITETEPKVKGNTTTIVFGRRQEFNA
jgi:hypothetical protein